MADQNTTTADPKVADATVNAKKLQEEADRAKMTPEERAAKDAEREAALAKSQAALDANDPTVTPGDTVESAKVSVVGIDPEMPASHHMAQKFGNDPANPKPAAHIPDNYDGPTVRLTMDKPDVEGLVTADVHPDMVGDYMRAGWSK